MPQLSYAPPSAADAFLGNRLLSTFPDDLRKSLERQMQWRRRRDSNPRYGFPYDALAKRWFQPLTHVSGPWRKRGYSESFAGDQRSFAVHCRESA